VLAWLAIAATLWSGDVSLIPAADPVGDRPTRTETDDPITRHPYLYTTLETAAGLAIGAAWYMRNGTDPRWDRALEWRSWKRKLFSTEDIVFDGDHFNTNTVGHPLDGAVYYQIARGNGLGPGASFLSSFLASTFWEYFVELPEHPSLNDLIMTPVGGAILGEATYQLGRYFAKSGSGTIRCAGALVFAPVATLNDRPFCRVRPGVLIPSAHLGLSLGINRAIFDERVVKDEFVLQLGSEIVSNRAYQRPGEGAVVVGPGQWTAIYLDSRLGEDMLEGIWLHARTVWGGRYDRNYRTIGDETDLPGAGGRPRGWGVLLAIGSSADYRMRQIPQGHDRIAGVGFGGPTFEWSMRRSYVLRAFLSAEYAFALVDSMAYRAYILSLVDDVIKTSLRDSGYYYGHGVVSAATLTADFGPIGFVADGRGAWYWSLNGADPAQSAIQRDVLLHDSRIYLSAALWTRPLGAFRFGIGVEHVRRTSNMLGTTVVGTESDVMATTAIGF